MSNLKIICCKLHNHIYMYKKLKKLTDHIRQLSKQKIHSTGILRSKLIFSMQSMSFYKGLRLANFYGNSRYFI